MRELTLKAKYLVVLQVPFNLDIPYIDRQRIVIVPDEQVEAERLSRARSAEEREQSPLHTPGRRPPINGDVNTAAAGESYGAVISRNFHRGLQDLQDVSGSMKRTLGDQAARWALRHQLGALMVGRGEASVLRLDQGHPLKNMLYVGHPAKPDLYFPAAEFHRRVFEHKFAEAVTLLTSLGASRIVVLQEEGHTGDKEWAKVIRGCGFTRVRNEQSRLGAVFQANFPGSRKPFLPDGLCWYGDEQMWQMITRARMTSGAEKASLAVTYTTDYGIDMRIIKAAKICGVNVGGRFHEQDDIIWQLDAEFPSLSE